MDTSTVYVVLFIAHRLQSAKLCCLFTPCPCEVSCVCAIREDMVRSVKHREGYVCAFILASGLLVHPARAVHGMEQQQQVQISHSQQTNGLLSSRAATAIALVCPTGGAANRVVEGVIGNARLDSSRGFMPLMR